MTALRTPCVIKTWHVRGKKTIQTVNLINIFHGFRFILQHYDHNRSVICRLPQPSRTLMYKVENRMGMVEKLQ